MGAQECDSSDDSSSLCSVDLGLGFGRKPGGLPKTDDGHVSGDLEVLRLFYNASSPTVEQTESSEVSGKDDQLSKSISWRNIKESIESFKEKGGLSKKISNWSLPKRSFSLRLRNRTNSESLIQKDDKVTGTKENSRGLRRINSVRGKMNLFTNRIVRVFVGCVTVFVFIFQVIRRIALILREYIFYLLTQFFRATLLDRKLTPSKQLVPKLRMSVVSPTSRFANGRFVNVSGQFANVLKSVRKRLEVSSQTCRSQLANV